MSYPITRVQSESLATPWCVTSLGASQPAGVRDTDLTVAVVELPALV